MWSCWTNGSHTWLFTCEMSMVLSRERGTPVLQASLHNTDGSLKESGARTIDPLGTWHCSAEVKS